MSEFRRDLEAAVADRNAGEISLADAATINSAMRWETHARLCARWLVEEKKLSTADKIKLSGDVARASTERDRCLKALGLDRRRSAGAWDVLLDAPRLAE